MKKILSLSIVFFAVTACSKEEKTAVVPAAIESAAVQSQVGTIQTDTVPNPTLQTGKKKVVKVKYPKPNIKNLR